MKSKTKKIIERIFSITWCIVFISLFITIIGIMVTKSKGQVPKVFGYSIMKIITPSMGEEIPVGTYILIKEVEPDEVKQDDIICFYSSDPAIYNYPNTHRVVEEPTKDGDRYVYITKGDANAIADAYPATSDRLIGKYVKTMGVITGISEMAQSPIMMVFIAIMIIGTLGIVIVVVVLKAKMEEDKKE